MFRHYALEHRAPNNKVKEKSNYMDKKVLGKWNTAISIQG